MSRKLPDGLWERNGTYYARFRANGKEVRKRLSTDFRAACQMLNALRARADKADFDLLDNDYSWDDLRSEFLKWAEQSVRNPKDYKRDLDRFEAYRKVRTVKEIDHSYVIGYRQWRLGQPIGTVAGKEWKKAAGRCVSPRTVNREVATLQNMLNKAVEWKRTGSNPIVTVKPLRQDESRKQRRALSAEEVEAIFREAPEYMKPILRLFATTGIRRDELVSLRFDDVDFEARCIVIRPSVAKSRKRREIPLDDETLAMLADLKEKAKSREPVPGKTPEGKFSRDHVFVTAANTPLKNNLLRAFYAICKRAGIEGAHAGGSVDLHSLRVTFTTLAIDNGASPKAVQEILGHSTLNLTMGVYAKSTERSKRDAVGALPFAKVSPPAHVVPAKPAHKVRTSEKNGSKPLEKTAIAG